VPRSEWIDRKPLASSSAVYVVRALDAAGNLSDPTSELPVALAVRG